jgi:hypothetical protein
MRIVDVQKNVVVNSVHVKTAPRKAFMFPPRFFSISAADFTAGPGNGRTWSASAAASTGRNAQPAWGNPADRDT